MICLQDLPTELLCQCFDYLRFTPELNHVRLTSRQLYEVVGPEPIPSLHVYLSSPASLKKLADIANHPRLAKTVESITFNVSFYDRVVAEDLKLFAAIRAGEVCREAEMYDYQRGDFDDEVDEEEKEVNRDVLAYFNAWQVHEEWYEISKDKHDKDKPTYFQKLLLDAHREYHQLLDAQESAKKDNAHVAPIAQTLQQLSGLQHVNVEDAPRQSDGHLLVSRCLERFTWGGGFVYSTGPPPAHLLADIFTALDQAGIFPDSFSIDLHAPVDLRILKQPSDQLCKISHVLSKATKLSFDLSAWARHNTFAVDNDRPHDEIIHLGRLTTAFFNVASLESMYLAFEGYPCFYEEPKISMMELLPLKTRTWPHLESISFSHIPFHQSDLEILSESANGKTMTYITMYRPFLLSGSWSQSLDLMRNGWPELERALVLHPKGDMFGGLRDFVPGPSDEMAQYLLRKREDNPL